MAIEFEIALVPDVLVVNPMTMPVNVEEVNPSVIVNPPAGTPHAVGRLNDIAHTEIQQAIQNVSDIAVCYFIGRNHEITRVSPHQNIRSITYRSQTIYYVEIDVADLVFPIFGNTIYTASVNTVSIPRVLDLYRVDTQNWHFESAHGGIHGRNCFQVAGGTVTRHTGLPDDFWVMQDQDEGGGATLYYMVCRFATGTFHRVNYGNSDVSDVSASVMIAFRQLSLVQLTSGYVEFSVQSTWPADVLPVARGLPVAVLID